MASAADIATVPGARPAASPVLAQLNPVPHETAVLATGARPVEGSDKRELFSESTTTVLVFEKGAVIRLAADVAPGQLIFLTHQGTKREVVAQVTKRRSFGEGSFYVELEFTEPAPGFWGLQFPAAPVPAAPNTPAREAEELVESGPAEGQAANRPGAGAEEVVLLKGQVEALREQLKALQGPRNTHDSSNLPAPSPLIAEQMHSLLSPPPVAPKNEPSPSAPLERQAPASFAENTPAEAATAEPVARDEDLPKPSLNFSMPPARGKRATEAAPAPKRPAALRIALLVAILLLVIGGAWFEGWIPGLPWLVNTSAGSAPPMAQPRVPVRASDTKPAASSSDGPAKLGPPKTGAPSSADAKDAPNARPAARHADRAARSPAATIVSRPATESVVSSRPSAKNATHASKDSTEARSVEPLQGAATVPPKLLKSVRALAPAEAVHKFVTGNVIVDAVVDAAGRVKSAKAVSGPEILHRAAVNAVQDYRYEPARRNGKPVSAPITVTVQFWYEP